MKLPTEEEFYSNPDEWCCNFANHYLNHKDTKENIQMELGDFYEHFFWFLKESMVPMKDIFYFSKKS